jgi:hypothetical protein
VRSCARIRLQRAQILLLRDLILFQWDRILLHDAVIALHATLIPLILWRRKDTGTLAQSFCRPRVRFVLFPR